MPSAPRRASAGAAKAVAGKAAPGVEPAPAAAPRTFAVETYVARTYNYLDRLVDQNGLPYFNVFWTDPAQAAHDWPDFGDVMSRQLQAAIMARHLTGQEAGNERTWMRKVRSYLHPDTGLLMRPKTGFSEPVADLGDQSLTLCTGTCAPWSGLRTTHSTRTTRCCSVGWTRCTATCAPKEPVSASCPRSSGARATSSPVRPAP